MQTYDEIGSQLDDLRRQAAALIPPGTAQEKLKPGSRAEYAAKKSALSQQMDDLLRQYQAAVGDPGAVTGRLPGGRMNAPPVPALQTAGALPAQPASTWANFGGDLEGGATATPGALPVRQPVAARGALPAAPAVTAAPALAAVPADMPAEDEPAQPADQPAATAQPAVQPATSLRDEFMKRITGMDRKGPAGMTEEQKGQALMEAGLAIMAAASKPGASALGAVGQGGMRGTAVARELEKINRDQADKQNRDAREDVRTEFTLAGQDEDRAIRKDDLGERREERKQRNVNDERRIDLLAKQVEAAGWQLKDGADGVVHAYNVRTGEDRKTPLKATSGRNQNIEFYSWLLKTPGAKELFTKSDVADMRDEGKRRAAYGQAYLKASVDPMGDMSKFPTFEEYSARMGIGGGSTLPPGIPPGSRQIGTSKGNPVYQTPDGKKLVVK